MHRRKQTIPAAIVTLDEVRDYVVDYDKRRGPLLARMIASATEWLETRTDRQFMPATWKFFADRWPANNLIELSPCPVREITQVQYYDENNVLQTLDAAEYQADLESEPARLYPAIDGTFSNNWPDVMCGRMNAIVITYVTGYSDIDDADKDQRQAVPELAKQLVLHHIGAAYESAEMRPVAEYLAALDRDVHPLLWTL